MHCPPFIDPLTFHQFLPMAEFPDCHLQALVRLQEQHARAALALKGEPRRQCPSQTRH